jgi:putative sugar O-methyltransferase
MIIIKQFFKDNIIIKILYKIKVYIYQKLFFFDISVFEINKKYYSEFLLSVKKLRNGNISTWDSFINKIYHSFLQDDKNSFLRFSIIQNTLHPPAFNLSKKYYEFLIKKKLFKEQLCKIAIESPVGNPIMDPNFKLSSPTLIQHTYHLYKLIVDYSVDFKKIDVIFEFGAGYGSFARLIKKMGYKKKYIIFDFPFMIALQKMYLKSVFATYNFNDNNILNDIFFYSGKNFKNVNISKSLNNLFVAAFSFSEIDLKFRKKVEGFIKNFKYIFITYQDNFDKIDNVKYFNNFTKNIKTHYWKNNECKIYKNHYYLFGVMK